MKALIVDDSPIDSKLLYFYITRHGWEAVEAQSGQEALEKLEESPFDLIISDAMMPEMDGYQLLRAIKKSRFRDLPFIIYTSSFTEQDDRALAIDMGADALIGKGEDPEAFWAELQKALENREGEGTGAAVLSEEEYLSRHSTILMKKLEAKLRQLEEAKAELATKQQRLEQEISERRTLMTRVQLLNQELGQRKIVQLFGEHQMRQELEALSPSFFSDLFAPLREMEKHCLGFFESASEKLEESGKRMVEQILKSAKNFPNHLLDLLDLPAVPPSNLKAPLKKISVLLSELEKDYDAKLDAEGRNCLQLMLREKERMIEHAEGLLDLLRGKRIEMRLESVDLAELAKAIMEEIRHSQPERGADFIAPAELMVKGDPYLLRVALENLLENAWKFTGEKPRAVIEMDRKTAAGGAAYFVRDNGAGFNPKDAGRLFTPFATLHPQAKYLGAGLGLTLVQVVIARHGGTVWAAGDEGEGATFYFSLGSR